jgi:hypothetical protein
MEQDSKLHRLMKIKRCLSTLRLTGSYVTEVSLSDSKVHNIGQMVADLTFLLDEVEDERER